MASTAVKSFFKKQNVERKMMNRMIKRLFDLTVTCAGLLCIWPLLIVLALLVRIKLGAPIFFRQKRPGLHGKSFMMIKFRTMTDELDKDGNLLPDSERLNPLGCFLRKLSMDELPGLFNVIKGDMSIVGPRPLLMQYLDHYTPEQARRHEVKPGITGWAQIHGRNNTPFSKRFAMDVWYVDNYSFCLDVRIIISTVVKVFKREGVRSDLEQCYSEVDDCGLSDDSTK